MEESTKPPENKLASVLSLADQKKTLAGSRIKTRRVLLNTLDSPLDIQWPKITVENEAAINDLLTMNLTPVREKNLSVSRQELKKIPKEERAQWRNNEREKLRNLSNVNKQRMSDCLVGLKYVLKAIEKNQASVVLCEKNPNPLMLTKFLVPLCRRKNIPLLALKNFTPMITKLLNVPRCLTIALKVSVQETQSPLHQLNIKLKEICDSCGLISAVNGVPVCPSVPECPIDEPEIENVEMRDEQEEKIDYEKFYLKKSAGQGRCFTPGQQNPLGAGSEMEATPIAMAADSKDFITLGPSETQSTYKTMKIKRLQPNPSKPPKIAKKTNKSNNRYHNKR